MDNKGQNTIDMYVIAYVTFLFVFVAFLNLGLNTILSVNLDLQPPIISSAPPPSISQCAGFSPLFFVSIPYVNPLCILASVFSPIDTLARIVGFTIANIGFFVQVMTINPQVGVLGLIIFAPGIVGVLMFIISVMRGR